MSPKAVHSLRLGGKWILWDHFVQVYEFNNHNDLRLYPQLSRDHIYPNSSEKMRNHLATNVLNGKMLHLFKCLQQKVMNPSDFDGVVQLLEHTSIMIDIFSNITTKVESMHDVRIHKLLSILDFFQKWESEYSDSKQQSRYLINLRDQRRY